MRGPAPQTAALFAALTLLYLYPLFYFPINNPNERVRVYMTAAMVDHGTFEIGRREGRRRSFQDKGPVYDRWGYVNDKALVCDDPDLQPPNCAGPLYSAKAPGTSFLAVPAYALYTLAGDTEDYRAVTLFLRFAVVLIPGLFFLWGFRRYASRWIRDPWLLDVGTLGLGLGSMLLTYSHMVAGHQMTAILLFTGFALTEIGSRDEETERRPLLLVLGGLATAMSVVVEYPSVVGAAAVSALILVRALRSRRWTWLFLFTAGCVGPAFLMGWFHTSAFGAPWRTAYVTLENPQFVKDIAHGFMGLRAPEWENLAGSFLAPYNGMFFFSPWMALIVPALVGLPCAVRRIRGGSTPARFGLRSRVGSGLAGAAGTAASVVLLFTLFISCHSLWRGGWTLGPRYIVGFVPFAAFLILLGVAALKRTGAWGARFLLAGLVLVSIAVTGSCSWVTQGFPAAFYNPLREATLPLLAGGYGSRTLGHSLGLTGAWAVLPLLPALAWVVWRIGAGVVNDGPRLLRPFVLFGTMGLAGLVFWGLLLPTKPPTIERVGALSWLQDHYEEDGGFPQAQQDLRDLREMGRRFRGDPNLAALIATEETRAGKWKEAKRLARRSNEARWKRVRRRATVAVALSALASIPRGFIFPLWDPEEDLVTDWNVAFPERRKTSLSRRAQVPKKSVEAEASEGGVPEDGLEFPLLDPLKMLRFEAIRIKVKRDQHFGLEFLSPGGVIGADVLTGIAPEQDPGATHRVPDIRRKFPGVLGRPTGETAPRVEDALSGERVRGAGSLAPPAIPAVPDGTRRMQPDEVPVHSETADEQTGAKGGMYETAAPSDPAEARVDRDSLLHDRRAVHKDPSPKPDPGPELKPDSVELAP